MIQELQILLPQEVFDTLRTQKPSLLNKFTIDLSTAHTKKEFLIQGTIFQVVEITRDAYFEVNFNEVYYPTFRFDSTQILITPFYRFFITNPAQSGATATIFCGLNSIYLPFVRAQVFSDDIVDIKRFRYSQIRRYDLTTDTSSWVTLTASTPLRGLVIYNSSDTVTVYLRHVGGTDQFPILPTEKEHFNFFGSWETSDANNRAWQLISPDGSATVYVIYYYT